MTRLTRLVTVLSAALLAAVVYASSATADGPGAADAIKSFATVPGSTQAGGHPDVEVEFEVTNRVLTSSHNPCNCEDAKDSTVEFPTGFIGNPHATPQCTIAEFSTNSCAMDSQVGIVEAEVTGRNGSNIPFDSAVYNLVPPPDVSGLTGFKVFGNTTQLIELHARTGGDYGLDATAISLYHGSFPLNVYRQDLWGVPAEHRHDLLRINKAEIQGGETAFLGRLCDADGARSTTDPNTVVQACQTNFRALAPNRSNSPLTPFLQSPTTCATPLSSSLDVLFYDGQTRQAGTSWPQMTGCDQLGFNPSLYAHPTTTATDSASGIEVDLSVPQPVSPTVPSPTELRATTVTLPAGFSINPGAADGKTACTDAEARFGTEEEAQCPDYSKIGDLTIESSALPGPLPGYVYLGQPLPGNRYRIFLVANGFAFHLKIPGTVIPDRATGQLTISFQNLPQSPLTAFDMHLFGSERGLLTTPTQCGTYAVTTTFTPWDETIGTQTSSQFFTLDQGPNGTPCPPPNRPFDPSLQAGVADKTAGRHTSFSLALKRMDGDQDMTAVTVATPPGFAATLVGVPYCSNAALAAAADPSYSGLTEIARPSCPAASQVGVAQTAAGSGTHPLYTPAKVYLAGPYKGAPLSLGVISPAVSGPYDLGNIVVRVAVHVDPADAHITAVSDPLPQILDGIPLRLRELEVNLNRPGFALNPTDCHAAAVTARVLGDQGAVAERSVPFQIADCSDLPFAPKLTLRVSGSVKHAGNPALHATLTTQPGESNISKTSVLLPRSELLDNAHVKSPCTRVQFAAKACPPASEIGHAMAVTPLLEQPLEGPVYLRSSSHKLPDIVAVLKGQFEVELDGRIDSVNERLRTTFETVPDAPVSKFTLDLNGGSKGLLVNSKGLCHSQLPTRARLFGQNGATDNQDQQLKTPCSGAAVRKRAPGRGHGAVSR